MLSKAMMPEAELSSSCTPVPEKNSNESPEILSKSSFSLPRMPLQQPLASDEIPPVEQPGREKPPAGIEPPGRPRSSSGMERVFQPGVAWKTSPNSEFQSSTFELPSPSSPSLLSCSLRRNVTGGSAG